MRVKGLLLVVVANTALAQSVYPRNAASCGQCHFVPSSFGGSRLTAERVGMLVDGNFSPDPEGGIRHYAFIEGYQVEYYLRISS
jgi:hypothetical protein